MNLPDKKLLKKKILETTWDELNGWAGTRSVVRGKGYISNVGEIFELPTGELISHVRGNYTYLTKVGLSEDGAFKGECSCPVGYRCKHTVALILKAAKLLRNGKEIEKCSELDPVVNEVRDEVDDQSESSTIETPKADLLSVYVSKLKDRECRNLLNELLENVEAVRPYLSHKIMMSQVTTTGLVKLAKRAIDTATDGYYDPWDRHGKYDEVPSYEMVRKYFEELRDAGDWKSLKDLGFRLLDKGQRQIMNSHDEGDIYGQIFDCMKVVLSAISASPMSPIDKARWALEYENRDHFSFAEPVLKRFLDEKCLSRKEWSKLADGLVADCRKQLQNMRIDSYDLGRPIWHAVKALRNARRSDEVVDLLEESIPRTKDYVQLVDLLIALGRSKEARDWCLKGIEDCDKNGSGCAEQLREKMRGFADDRGDYEMVAAYDAQFFFSHSSISTYAQMQKACEKVGKWDNVRKMALLFLESGKRPESKRGWPLPKVDSPVYPGRDNNFPDIHLLIEIALQEKRHADAVMWYRKQMQANVHSWNGFPAQGWDVADAVAKDLPEDALSIWQYAIKQNSGMAADYAYQAIVRAFEAMRPVMKRLGRRYEWESAVAAYREEYKRRKNLVKMLDGLLGVREKLIPARRIDTL